MTPGVPAKVIASSMGLGAFAIAIIAGLAVDNPPDRILGRALLCMVICQTFGFAIGLLAERTVTESIKSYVKSQPLEANPIEPPGAGATTDRAAA